VKLANMVNIGCGMTPVPGWINYDNSLSIRLANHPIITGLLKQTGLLGQEQVDFIDFAINNKILFADASKKIPEPDESINALYSSHMLEHLSRKQAISFLKEARRVLAVNGIIRISVPDIRIMVDKYINNENADEFIQNLQMAEEPPSSLAEKIRYLLAGNRNHKWMYDGESLCKLLKLSGFSNPLVLEPGKTTITSPGELDLWERASQSVFVEARKS